MSTCDHCLKDADNTQAWAELEHDTYRAISVCVDCNAQIERYIKSVNNILKGVI